MSDSNMTSQNVIGIRSAEDPDDFNGWGGTGWYPPPLGTALDGTTTVTLDNSGTPASNTPGQPIYEVIEHETNLQITADDDQKEMSPLSSRNIYRDPGKKKLDLTMELFEEKGTDRWGGARRFHPTNKEYREDWYAYPRYEIISISEPEDSSGNPILVEENFDKTTVVSAKKVIWLGDVTFSGKTLGYDTGDKVKSSLTGNAKLKRVFNEYTFEGSLLTAATFSGVTTDSLDNDIVIPTRLKFTITDYVAGASLTITGKNIRNETITEVIGVTANGTVYSDHVFAIVNALGIVSDVLANFKAAISADELY